MVFRTENKLGELGKKVLLEIGSGLVLFELFVVDCMALTEQRIRAEAIDVILPSVRGGAQ